MPQIGIAFFSRPSLQSNKAIGSSVYGSVENYWGAMIMHCCRIMNGIKNKNIKNSLGATWNASHLAVRLCALRHWKRVSMPPTTQSLRHPLTRAFHVASRIKTARRSRRKTPEKM